MKSPPKKKRHPYSYIRRRGGTKVIEYMTAEEKEVLLREIAKFRVYKPETLENVLGEFLYELNVKRIELSHSR